MRVDITIIKLIHIVLVEIYEDNVTKSIYVYVY